MTSVRTIGIVVAALLAVGMAWATLLGAFQKPRVLQPTAPVASGDIEETVLATGILKPIKMVAVGAQVSGRVTQLNVKIGQSIKQGDLIAQIDPVTKQNDLRTAEAALENMLAQRSEKEATLALAESSLARQQLTLAQKASSRADFDTAEATVRQTRAQIAGLDAQIKEASVSVENARVNLDYTSIRAPIDGTILSVVTQEGQTVNAVQSAPTIVVLGQVEKMVIRAEISEVDVVKVRSGQDVYFTILGDPDHRFGATLDFIEPAPESEKSDSSFTSSNSASGSSSSSSSTTSAIYYNGVFTTPNWEGRLRTYMTAEVHVIVAQANSTLTIPSSALVERNTDGTYLVQVAAADGTLSNRRVKIGLKNNLLAQVISGLKEGEQVARRSAASDVKGPPSGPSGPTPGF